MKKIVTLLLCLVSVSYAFASPCTDIKNNLSRRQENQSVRALQNFLYDKGYLQVAPNGYFGAGTFAAVKTYQKSLGFEQTGSLGPITRNTIKKETCTSDNSSQTVSTSSANTTVTIKNPTLSSLSQVASGTTLSKTMPPTVNTPSGLRNARRRADLEKILRSLFTRFADTRGVHPIYVTEKPIELCVVPQVIMSTATATEVAVLATPVSPCATFADITSLSPVYLLAIPRDPSLATTSTLLGYTIVRSESNDITLSATSPEDGAIIKVTCNFNSYCTDLRHISAIEYSKPVYASSSASVLLRDAWSKDGLKLFGKNFTATNTITAILKYPTKTYILGTFGSTDGTSLTISASSTNQSFPCGNGCFEKLPLGEYNVVITNAGGSSNQGYFVLKGYTTSSLSVRNNTSVVPNTKSVKLGSFMLSSSMPLLLKSMTLNSTTTSSNLPGKISNLILKDSLSNTVVAGGGATMVFTNQTLYENESKVYDIYADIAEVLVADSGYITYGGYFTVRDPITKVDMDLPLKEISFSVSY